MFTGIDFIIVLLGISGILLGVVRGFVGSIIDLTGITAGLILASIVYEAPVHLFKRFNITGNAVELVCFLLSSVVLVFTIILLLDLLRKRVDIKHFLDRFFGLLPGIIEGFIFAGGILVVMSVSFNSATEIQGSKTAKYVIRFIPKVYEKIERKGVTLPKMIFLPKNYGDEFNPLNKTIQFIRTNFVELEGATCLKCDGKVKFAGYFPKLGVAVIPEFVCTKCGRTSDGCQTYEGFHLLYRVCPVKLAKQKQRFDCGNWPNREIIIPEGPCPVCGTEF